MIRWDGNFLNFEIRKFSIHNFPTRERKCEKVILENKIKVFGQDSEENEQNQEYVDCKRKLNDIFDRNVKGIKIRIKCKWYEEGEKNSKFFLNLEKNCAIQSKVRLLEKKKCKEIIKTKQK